MQCEIYNKQMFDFHSCRGKCTHASILLYLAPTTSNDDNNSDNLEKSNLIKIEVLKMENDKLQNYKMDLRPSTKRNCIV